jgi:uncharacterized protein
MMPRFIAPSILAAACAILSTGCISSGRLAERTHLSRHPVRETRMSSQPEEGWAPSGVWRIRGVRNTVYLVGTSHVVAEDQIPFPSPFYAAYQDSKEIYVEFDNLSLFSQVRFAPKAFKWMMSHRAELLCPKGRNLENYLSAATVQRLQAFYGKDYRKRENMTPLFLVLMAEIVGPQGAENGGVEDIFRLLARQEGKPTRTLDDPSIVDTALLVMDAALVQLKLDMARRGADAVVEEKILGADDEANETVWRQGDLAAVETIQAEMKKEAPAIYEKLLVERNRKWMGKLRQALHAKNNVMVLAGVAHMGGKDGLVELLRQAGFPAEQMYGLDRPRPEPWPEHAQGQTPVHRPVAVPESH